MSQSIQKKYYRIDKAVISEEAILNFNLFRQAAQNNLLLVYKKGTKLTKEMETALLSQKSLYVYEEEKGAYEKFYKELMSKSFVPEKVDKLYERVSKSVDKMFENPESLGNVKAARGVVGEMMGTILCDDFTVTSFISILSYDYYTHTHSLNASVYAICLGKQMGLGTKELEDLGTSALLHDLGKSKVDHSLINKNGKLTDAEFAEVKKHPVYGFDIAKKLNIENQGILNGIRNHHEKMDGSGYPDGLAANEIHDYAKIIAFAMFLML